MRPGIFRWKLNCAFHSKSTRKQEQTIGLPSEYTGRNRNKDETEMTDRRDVKKEHWNALWHPHCFYKNLEFQAFSPAKEL